MITLSYIRVYSLAVAILAILCCVSRPADLPSPDIAYREYRRIKLEDKDGYPIESKVRVEVSCLSDHGARDQRFYVYDYKGASVDKVTARVNGKKVKKQYIGEVYPKAVDEFYSELRLWIVTFPDAVHVGDTLSYEYKVKYDDPAQLDVIDIPNVNFVERFEIEFECPKGVAPGIEWYFPADSVPMTLTQVDDRKFLLTVDSLPKRRDLPNCEFSDVQARGLITFHQGDESLTPSTPREFVSWYLPQIPFSMDLPPEVEPELYAAVIAAPDTLAAVEMIHDFVRKNIRYIADAAPPHTIIPHAPADVLAKRYGDCKDRAFLVTALAARHGITVYPCIVSAFATREFSGVSYHLFNHAICAIDTDSGLLFFDPTPRNFPMGTLPSADIGHYAVVVDPDSPRVEVLWPRDTLPGLEVHLTGDVDSLDKVRAEMIIREGYRSDVLYAHDHGSDYEFRQFLSEHLPGWLYQIALDSFALDSIGERELRVTARADLSKFAVRTSTRMYLPKVPFVTVDREVLEREGDDWTLMAGIPRNYVLTLDLRSPGYSAVPDSLRLAAGDLAELTADLSFDDSNMLHIDYRYRLRTVMVPADGRQAYLDFCRACLDSKRDLFTLEEGNKP